MPPRSRNNPNQGGPSPQRLRTVNGILNQQYQQPSVPNNYSASISGAASISNSNNNQPSNNIQSTQQSISTNVPVSSLTSNVLTKLLPHQREALKRVRTVIQGQRVSGLNNNNNNNRIFSNPVQRGHLFWLKTGSGKTALGAGIIASYFMFGRVPPTEQVYFIVLSSQENIKINDGSVYKKELCRYYQPWLNDIKQLMGVDIVSLFPQKTRSRSMIKFWSYKQAHTAFMTVRHPGTYQKMREQMERGTARFVIVMDEIHDIASNDSIKQNSDINADIIHGLRSFLTNDAPHKFTRSGHPMFHVYGMTATPGDTKEEFYTTMAMVGPSVNAGNTVPQYKRLFETMNSTRKASIMKNLIYWKDPRQMINTSGQSIFPEQIETRQPVPMTVSQYLLSMGILGRAAKFTNHKSGQYRAVRTNNSLRGIPKRMLNKKQLTPEKTTWLDKLASMQLYLTQDDMKQYFKSKDMLKKTRKSAFAVNRVKEKKINNQTTTKKYTSIGDWIKVEVPLQSDKTRKRTYYVPKNGKLHRAMNMIKQTQGRQLVYTKDPIAARILGQMLSKVKVKGSSTYMFNNITSVFETADYPRSLDMIFDFPGGFRPDILRHPDVMRVIEVLLQIRKRSVNTSKSSFVVGTKPTVVARASQSMDIDEDMDRLIRLLEDRLVNVSLNSNLNIGNVIPRLKGILKELKCYNMNGESLRVLILGGGKLYQGLNIRALRKVYILDELHNLKQFKQLLGRASRGFGHKNLAPNKRNVEIIQYVSTIPDNHEGLGVVRKNAVTGMYTNHNDIQYKNSIAKLRTMIARTFRLSDQTPNDIQFIDSFARDVYEGMEYMKFYQGKLTGMTKIPINKLTVNESRKVHRNYKSQYKNLTQFLNSLKQAA
jgi:hypothetical protein